MIEAIIEVIPRNTPTSSYPYHNKARPPKKEPKAEPTLFDADLIDTKVPLNSGTCSKVKLPIVEKAKAVNKPPRNLAEADNHRLGRFVYAAINNPATTPVITDTCFLPYL